MQNEVKNLAQLKELISAAFPKSLPLSHSECEDLRTELGSLRDDDLLVLLGPVLADLLSTHTNSSALPDWSDSVIRFLAAAAPPAAEPITGLSVDINHLNKFAASRAAEIKDLFSKFTIDQAYAVYSWLQVAKSWEESNIPKDELAASLYFWKRRCQKRAD